MSTPYAAPRCEPQRGRLLPLAEALKLHRLLKRYLPCHRSSRKLQVNARTRISFAEMYELFDGADGEPWPALPPNAADRMTDMLTCIRKVLQQLIPGDLPDEPTELLNVPSPETDEFDIDLQSDVSELYEGDDGITGQDALDPDERMLKLIVPRTGRELIVVVFFRPETPPYVGRWWAPNAAAFKFSDYQFQHSLTRSARYSVATENTPLRTRLSASSVGEGT
ncbi:hypothetical protein B0H14DRAFT_2647044 [Mycena olivaceomarginata]|nr:hypothetical protein B0H14DRAFT_2647044 [Mycena olivaceomarginata]